MRKINKYISYNRFESFSMNECVHRHRYRFGHTKDRFKEYAEI